MLKPALIIILSFFVYQTALAQKDTSVYYLNSYGKIVTKKYAELYILILPPDSSANKELFPVDGFYLDGKKLFTATSITKSLPLNFQGNYVTYFKNGFKMSIKQYDHGTFTGDETLFYPNGKFYCKISMVSTPSFVFTDDDPGKFYSKKTLVSNKDTTELQFTDCSDSTGKVLAKNGNGYWIIFNDDFSRITKKGKIVNGLQDSVWQMSPDENNTYTLFYKNGKILKDKNFLDKRINTSLEQVPSFPGGLDAFGEFLGHNIKYPADAREIEYREG